MALFGRKKKAPEPQPEVEPERLPQPPAADAAGRRDVAAQRDYLVSLVEPLPAFGMQLLDALGLPLCEDLTADQAMPTVDLAMVEGYAVAPAEVAGATPADPVVLPLAGEIGIGEEATGETPTGSCVRLVAGAPLPRGTAAVVPLEHAELRGDDVAVTLAVEPGQYVRAAGSDIAAGETLLRQGDRLNARLAGMLAGAGIDRVMARPRPRVVVIATGAELVEPGHRLRSAADTYDATSYLLAAAARDLGATVFRVGAYTRDPAELREILTDQLIRADLLITTGGVSEGDELLRDIVPELGMTDFAQVAMSPGEALGFGLIGDDRTPLVMLPGNPVSAHASYLAFVVPLLRTLMGDEPAEPPLQRAVAAGVVRSRVGETTLVRAVVSHEGSGRVLATPLVTQSAHQLGELARANAVLVVPPEREVVEAGESVQYWPLPSSSGRGTK